MSPRLSRFIPPYQSQYVVVIVVCVLRFVCVNGVIVGDVIVVLYAVSPRGYLSSDDGDVNDDGDSGGHSQTDRDAFVNDDGDSLWTQTPPPWLPFLRK